MSMTGGTIPYPDLASVRRFEAAGFRAWPAASVHYDGAWAVRLTAGHPARRLNSVNPLDPSDDGNVVERIEKASRLFSAYGRPLTFRISPLSSRAISSRLDSLGWQRLSESVVMRIGIDEPLVRDAMDQIPLKDMGRFVSAAIAIGSLQPALRPGLSEVISSIEPEAGLFVMEREKAPVSTAICVQDGELAGLFEVATKQEKRGRGFGRRVLLSALKWARSRGARTGWLQVEAGNEAAIGLYASIGFEEVYRYHYRQPPETSEA